MSKSHKNRNRAFLLAFGILIIPLMLWGITIHVKISAPNQVPVMKLSFPKKTYGLGVKFAFIVEIFAEPSTKITNIRIMENYNFGEKKQELKNWKRLDSGLSEITLIQCKVQLFKNGIYEYSVIVEGHDEKSSGFSRSASEQINVEEVPDETTAFSNEISPFLLNSDNSVFHNGKASRLDESILTPEFKEDVETFVQLPRNYKLLVAGYADHSVYSPVETRTNLLLSSNRAQNMATLLIQKFHVPAERILIRSFGSSDQAYPDKPGALINRNRRIVVSTPGI